MESMKKILQAQELIILEEQQAFLTQNLFKQVKG
jgi:hypothetical protein